MKARYSLLLLDADGTLFDFSRAEREAFGITCAEFGLPQDEETYTLYSSINDAYWHALNCGEISKRELVIRRFEDLLRAISRKGSARKINARYLKNLGESAYLMPHAEEVCRALSTHCRLVIATNGVGAAQYRRLELSPIAPFITALIASDRAGADKPSPRFFDYLFEQIPPVRKSETLIVGDMLGADIRGGIDYGLDTCWFNPGEAPAPENWPITYTISSLDMLEDIVFPVCAAANSQYHFNKK